MGKYGAFEEGFFDHYFMYDPIPAPELDCTDFTSFRLGELPPNLSSRRRGEAFSNPYYRYDQCLRNGVNPSAGAYGSNRLESGIPIGLKQIPAPFFDQNLEFFLLFPVGAFGLQ